MIVIKKGEYDMKLKEFEVYSGVQISQNEKTGSFFLKSPVNGTQRIFSSIEMARNYIDHCYVLDSHAMAMGL